MATPFQEKVYSLLELIPPGKVTTYKEIAHYLGLTSYRAIGQALKANTHPEKIPCYKVVASDGKISGYCGNSEKMILVKINKLRKEGLVIEEGTAIEDSRIINFKKSLFQF